MAARRLETRAPRRRRPATEPFALAKPGDTILGMSLDAGGHLTHGAKPNLSGKWFNAVQYGVRRQDSILDYDQVADLAAEHRPKIIIAGGSAYSRVFDFARFREIADSVGAYLMVDMAHFAGIVAGGAHPSEPLLYAGAAVQAFVEQLDDAGLGEAGENDLLVTGLERIVQPLCGDPDRFRTLAQGC